MQFQLSTLLWATLVVATSLGLAGLWGIPLAAYWIVGFWWVAGRGGEDAPRRGSHDALELVMLGMAFVCTGLLLPMWSEAKEPAWRSACARKLRMIPLGLHNYHAVHKRFPPATTLDASGKPAHSWRVLLLPFMEQTPLYQQYDFKQPWNAAGNRNVATARPYDLECPSAARNATANATDTNYLAVVGPRTFWDPATVLGTPPAASTQPGNVAATPEDARIMVVDVAQSGVAWAEPKDLTAEQFLAAFSGVDGSDDAKIRSPHPRGFQVALANGSVQWIPVSAPRELLETMLYDGLTPQAEEHLKALQAAYMDRYEPDPLRHIEWRLLAWAGSIVAFGIHAYRVRRGPLRPPLQER